MSLSANTRTKGNVGKYCALYAGMEWELQVMGQSIFGSPVSTNTTSDMSSMAQE